MLRHFLGQLLGENKIMPRQVAADLEGAEFDFTKAHLLEALGEPCSLAGQATHDQLASFSVDLCLQISDLFGRGNQAAQHRFQW
jgi:hypothetical protein